MLCGIKYEQMASESSPIYRGHNCTEGVADYQHTLYMGTMWATEV